MDNILMSKRFQIDKKIGQGSFGDVYKGKDTYSDEWVAIKVEKTKKSKSRLEQERDIYNLVKGNGIPKIFHYEATDTPDASDQSNGKDSDQPTGKILIMSFLGPSLEELFDFCGRKFSLKSICMLGIQMIERMAHIHKCGIIHRDIKPDNFLIGIGPEKSKVFLVDFGLSKSYVHNHNHIQFRNDKNFTGTYRYSSIRNHRGIEQSRRDDLESVGYLLIYFSHGSLPWQGIRIADKAERNHEIYRRKRKISLKELCQNLPSEFYEYMRYCRMIRFSEEPDYQYLRELFIRVMKQYSLTPDGIFDWNEIAIRKKAESVLRS
jgi:serine/threonine protein kinase